MAKLNPPKKRKFEYLWEESYIAMIKNSVGTSMFRNFYVRDEEGNRLDILNDGNVSCGIYVSYILKNFNLIKDLHFTVARLIDDMLDSGWEEVNPANLKEGDVILWLDYQTRSTKHAHVGFYVGDEQAISNSSKKQSISQHHFTYLNKREIVGAYRPNWSKKK